MPSPLAARRPRERGILHGLSLVILTVVIFAGLLLFAVKEVKLTCRCADGSTQETTRTALEQAKGRCADACRAHGGGEPLHAAGKAQPKPAAPAKR